MRSIEVYCNLSKHQTSLRFEPDGPKRKESPFRERDQSGSMSGDYPMGFARDRPNSLPLARFLTGREPSPTLSWTPRHPTSPPRLAGRSHSPNRYAGLPPRGRAIWLTIPFNHNQRFQRTNQRTLLNTLGCDRRRVHCGID